MDLTQCRGIKITDECTLAPSAPVIELMGTCSTLVVPATAAQLVLRRGTISCEGNLLKAPPDVLQLVLRCLVHRANTGSSPSTASTCVGLVDAARLGMT